MDIDPKDSKVSEEVAKKQKEDPAGFRMTLPRRMILERLKTTNSYLSADDIFVSLYPQYPGIGLATIYRTLNLLEEHGMINKVNIGDGKARFAFIEQGEDLPHYHQLVCKRCFKIIKFNDFSAEELDNMRKSEKKYEERYHFSIESHIVQYYGLCEDCQKLAEKESD